MSELTVLREQAIKDDKAYGVTRLREEFRMKPSPGVLQLINNYCFSPYDFPLTL